MSGPLRVAAVVGTTKSVLKTRALVEPDRVHGARNIIGAANENHRHGHS
jgi:hypothetical protein